MGALAQVPEHVRAHGDAVARRAGAAVGLERGPNPSPHVPRTGGFEAEASQFNLYLSNGFRTPECTRPPVPRRACADRSLVEKV